MKPASPAMRPMFMIGGLAFAFIVQMTVSLLTVAVPVIAPEIAKGRGLSLHLLTFYLPIVYTAAFFANFLVPKLLPRFGGAGLGLACIAAAAAGLGLMLPASLLLTAAAPVVLGLALGGVTPATSQVVGPLMTPRTSGLIMSIRQSALPAGGLLAGVILPALAIYWGWHALLLVALASVVSRAKVCNY